MKQDGAFETTVSIGQAGFRVMSGDWIADRQDDEFGEGGVRSAAGCDAGNVRWQAELPAAGYYSVYVRYRSFPNSSSAAPYTVRYDGGEETVRLDQRMQSGQWVFVGTYRFPSGSSGVAELAVPEDGPVSAGSVRFVYVPTEPGPFAHMETLLFRELTDVHSAWGALRTYSEPRCPIGTEEDEPDLFSRTGGSLGALTNAEFSTYPFIAPLQPLRVNVDVLHGTAALTQGSYCMVSVHDAGGRVIPGFEKDKSLIGNVTAQDCKLVWNGADTARLAGQTVFLRFYIRKARVYSLHTRKKRGLPLSGIRMTVDNGSLKPWDTTYVRLRGYSADNRFVPVHKLPVIYTTDRPDLIQLKEDKLDVHLAYLTVIGDVAEATTATVTAYVRSAGGAIASDPLRITVEPAPDGGGGSGASSFKLLFMHPDSLHDRSESVELIGHPLEYYTDTQGLPTTPRSMTVYSEAADGGYRVWGDSREGDVYRADTKDGIRYVNKRPIVSDNNSLTSDHILTMTYSPEQQKHLIGERGLHPHRWYTLQSTDGGATFGAKRLAFFGHDALHIKWLPESQRYIGYHLECLYTPERKRYGDNAGLKSRTFLKWTSGDGADWKQEGPLLTPDELDPPEVELYWMNAFRYGDLYVGMLMTYAPSPDNVIRRFPYGPPPSKHGPHVKAEWIVSADGEHWERLYRREEHRATKDVRIFFFHEPMILHDRLLFLIGNQSYIHQQIYEGDPVAGALPGQNLEVYSLPIDRIAGAAGPAGGTFATKPFVCPEEPLHLNVNGAVRVEVLGEDGTVMPGFERQLCVAEGDRLHAPLTWNGHTTAALAGSTIRLRFHFERPSAVYSVHGYIR